MTMPFWTSWTELSNVQMVFMLLIIYKAYHLLVLLKTQDYVGYGKTGQIFMLLIIYKAYHLLVLLKTQDYVG